MCSYLIGRREQDALSKMINRARTISYQPTQVIQHSCMRAVITAQITGIYKTAIVLINQVKTGQAG